MNDKRHTQNSQIIFQSEKLWITFNHENEFTSHMTWRHVARRNICCCQLLKTHCLWLASHFSNVVTPIPVSGKRLDYKIYIINVIFQIFLHRVAVKISWSFKERFSFHHHGFTLVYEGQLKHQSMWPKFLAKEPTLTVIISEGFVT